MISKVFIDFERTPIMPGTHHDLHSGKTRPYRDYSSYLRELFGCRVQKISLDAGLTCPNRDGSLGYGGCIYCNHRGSGTAAARTKTIGEQIAQGKAFLARRYKASRFIAYFQSFTNTYAPLPHLKQLYGQALADPDVVGLNIGTRPDCVADPVLDHLARLSTRHLIWIEYGLQSSHDRTLQLIRRGHDVQAFIDAVRRTRMREIPVCVHVILGLPGETRDDMLQTARFLASQDIQGVKIHLLYVIRGTVLSQWHATGKYRCLSRDEYVQAVAEFLALLPDHVVVHRLTGDPHPEELAAPAWALEKHRNLQEIVKYMEQRSLRQGGAFQPDPPGERS